MLLRNRFKFKHLQFLFFLFQNYNNIFGYIITTFNKNPEKDIQQVIQSGSLILDSEGLKNTLLRDENSHYKKYLIFEKGTAGYKEHGL